MDGARERGRGSERRREGATGEGSEQGRNVEGMEIRREVNFKGGTLKRTLASIGLQYTAVSAQNNTQRGPCHCGFGITNTKF